MGRQDKFLSASRSVGVALVLLCAPLEEASAQARAPEAAVKAAFLSKFALFVQWPPPAFASPTDSLSVCIAGDQDLSPMVRDITRAAVMDGRPIVVRRLERVDRGSRCHILFVTSSHTQSVREALQLVRGTPTLTVTDNSGQDVGVINFVRVGSTVRFAIDDQAAAVNRLAIRSKLLQLAVSVRRRG